MDDYIWLNRSLWDRQLVDSEGYPVGRADDVELSSADVQSQPEITAILCGPLAYGPRLGRRLGTYWAAIGRRFRSNNDDYPVRIPFEWVAEIHEYAISLRVPASALKNASLEDWLVRHVISELPGSGAS